MKRSQVGLSLALLLGVAAAVQKDENPVTRVVGLLEGLQSRIEKDGSSEQAAYDKYACWCETTTAKTAATITSVRDLLKTTGNTILRLKGSVATLASEIQGLATDIKENLEQQEQQTNIREKENTAFMAEKSETEQALAALEKAIIVLKTASGASFMQTSKWTSMKAELISKMSQAALNMKMNEKQISLLSELSGHKSAYAPQSATIQGILTDMYTTFSKNLQTSISDEANAHRNYEDLMATYQKQLATLQETVVKKEQRKSEDEMQLADAIQTYDDSEEQLKAETKLFDATKASCTTKTSDWSKRSTLRSAELAGIKKALEILTSDEAKELFAKSIKPGFSKGGASFMQVSSHQVSVKDKESAFNALESRARQAHSFRLAALAAEVRMHTAGHFDEVLNTIDNLLSKLDDEEKADIKKVDECRESYQDITSNKNDLDWKIENNKAKVQKHEKAIDQKTDAKDVTITDIESADKQLKDMLDERTKENAAYTKAKSDDEKAVGLLQKAKAALAEYYDKSFLQQPEPEMKLSGADNAKNQNQGVVNMLDMIIEDLQGELAEGKSAEAAAQADYDNLKAAVEDQKAKLNSKKINLEGQIAEEGTSKTAEEDLKKDNEKDLKTEKQTETDLKKTCDDAIKLQPERREKRKIEADGLTQAKEFLAGLSSDALIQAKSQPIKSKLPKFLSLSL